MILNTVIDIVLLINGITTIAVSRKAENAQRRKLLLALGILIIACVVARIILNLI